MIQDDIGAIVGFATSLLVAKFALNDIPHITGLFKGNGGGEALEHFMLTGKYLWKGKEYNKPPHQLEIDVSRGVIYLHNLLTGKTFLRVCRIPDDMIRLFEVGVVVIDLLHSPIRRGGKGGKIIKKEPTFLIISGGQELLAGRLPGPGEFKIVDETDSAYFEFRNVPANLIRDLWFGEFVDITLDSEAKWRIYRYGYEMIEGDLQVARVRFASGNTNFDKVWDDREELRSVLY
ncbi:unnamed protein product [marine sediment metagenome]|uniref:Uncharacterized protein n=1 Tax=marine sediment metagenome TaxID=412755 RepID=X1TGD3_9ZZZZ